MSVSSRNSGGALDPQTNDRRAHERHSISPRLYVILDRSDSDGILNDVSEGGAALDIVGSQPAGEYLMVDFEMSEIGQHFKARGRIAWRDDAHHKVGVNFVDLPEESRNLIKGWLAKKSAPAELPERHAVQPAIGESAAVPQPAPENVKPREQQLEKPSAPQAVSQTAPASPGNVKVPAAVNAASSGASTGAAAREAQLAASNASPSSAPASLPSPTPTSRVPAANPSSVPPVSAPPSLPSPTPTPRVPLANPSTVPPVSSAPAQPSAAPVRPRVDASRERDGDSQDDRQGNIVLQNLLDSFRERQANPRSRTLQATLTAALSNRQAGSPRRPLQRWVVVVAVAFFVVLLFFGVSAYRSSARNGGPISVSKIGRVNTAASAQLDAAEAARAKRVAENSASASDRGNGGGGDNADPPSDSRFPPSALLSSLAASLPKGSRPPCINVGLPGDKIRIYLWTEKGTPSPIVAGYAKYLQTVMDVRVVDKAPYDLVLYVNGANVDADGAEAGFIWSSRVFRPWYCGQSLGLLEQTQVNESLHFVQGVNLDQHIQAEVANLVLHTFESIRTEQDR
jgi:hypothetical protein